MSDNNEPSFDAAPQRTDGGLSGNLKGKRQNYKRINPKVQNLIIFSGVAVVALIMFAIMSIDSSPKPKAKKEDSSAGTTMQGSLPPSVMNAPNGVPSASAPPVAEAPAGTSMPVNAGVPAIAHDDLAGERTGRVPGLSGSYPEHAAPREKSAAEIEADRADAARREALQRGADSSLSGQDATSAAAALRLPPASVATLGGGIGAIGGGQTGGGMVPLAEDPNRQVRKEQFLKDASLAQLDDTLLQVVHKPLSPYTINAGWLIPSIMVGGMKSDLPGQLRAQVRENVKDTVTGAYTLIPRGSTLIGTYDSQIAFGQSRVLVVWSRVIFPDGSSLNLQGMPGADEQGFAGLTGDVDNHFWPIIKAAVFMSVISAGAQLSQPQSSNANGSYGAPNAGQQMAAALGQQLGQAGSQLFSRYLNIQPTITTDPGTRFNILVTKDMVFPKAWSWDE